MRINFLGAARAAYRLSRARSMQHMHIVASVPGARPPPFRARLNYAHAYAANIRRTRSSNVFRIRMRII